MGGIGKTTLATSLFNKISPQYNACCYIDDLSKIYLDFGATIAQKQLLCQALNQENMKIQNLSHGTMFIRTRLCHLKMLIVLDNVDQIEQLENLALYPEYLGAGSRVIIVFRDYHILKNYGINKVYNVQLLDETHALQLFCKKAFKSNHIRKEYIELTNDVLKYVKGLPLAIKVLGSFLHDRDVCKWRSALARMKENPRKDIMDVLQISFDGLESLEKEIFLDLACFLSRSIHYWSETKVKKLLNYREFYADIGMKVLIEKSLISLQGLRIEMHDLLKELGKSIIRKKAPKEPRKWNRLWDYKDFQQVMKTNEESENLEAIVIQQHRQDCVEGSVRVDGLSKMNHLELLILENSLPKLKILDLSHSKNLIEMPDLRGVPHLTDLILEGCIKIVQIDPSIGILRELVSLNLKNCKNLVGNLNIIFGLSSLRELNLSGCSKLLISKLSMNPKETKHMEKADKNTNVFRLSTSSVYKLLTLPFHFLSSPKPEDSLGLLLPYLSRFRCLSNLNLSFCNLLQIPYTIGSLHCLVELNLGGNKFVTLPSTIKQLSQLQRLNLEHLQAAKIFARASNNKNK